MQEIWKDIPGYEDLYQVSNLGNVKSFARSGTIGMELKPRKARGGYVRFALCKKNNYKHMLAHRLVALTFIPNPENKTFVNHIDGIKSNNRVSNLEWVTSKENAKHAIESGLWKGEMWNRKKRPVKQIDINGNIIAIFPSASEAARKLKCRGSHIGQICMGKGRVRTQAGFKWEFA